MKNICFFSFFLILFFSCVDKSTEPSETLQPTQTNTFAIVIHGGAGNITLKNLSPEKQEEYKIKLTEAITTGYKILNNEVISLKAVKQTIMLLEI